jgi:hypothetical protein
MQNPNPSPVAPVVTVRDLLAQFWADIYGKEVQSAATYSYMWTADQMGHICIGLVLDFALSAVAWNLLALFGVTNGYAWLAAGFLATSAIVSYWEYSAYGTDVDKAAAAAARGGLFLLDKDLLRRNAVVAAGYMVLGGAVGLGFHLSLLWGVLVTVAVVVIAVLIAPYWLRQKIIWQKAALPFLARLADSTVKMPTAQAGALSALIATAAPPAAVARQVVIAGPVGSGRTSLATAIGTEFAFNAGAVRYVNFSSLAEMAANNDYEYDPQNPNELPGPPNIGYWRWARAQVLIVDDLGPVLLAAAQQGVAFDEPGLLAWLRQWLGNIAPALGNRHTVWIMGEVGAGSQAELDACARAIAGLCGGKDPLAILLGT